LVFPVFPFLEFRDKPHDLHFHCTTISQRAIKVNRLEPCRYLLCKTNSLASVFSSQKTPKSQENPEAQLPRQQWQAAMIVGSAPLKEKPREAVLRAVNAMGKD
jgi:hypothetical protein